jgi:hypothetical protein
MSDNERPVIGDDAEAAIKAWAHAKADLTAALVALVARASSGDPEDSYENYLFEAARALEINLDAALDQAAEAGFLHDIDRPAEEVRREPSAQADLTAALVDLAWRNVLTNPNNEAYDAYLHDVARAAEIDLGASFTSAVQSGRLRLPGLDGPEEDLLHDVAIVLTTAQAVRRARVAGMREVADVLAAESGGGPRLMATSRIVEYIRARADRVEAEGSQDDPCPGWPQHSRRDHDAGGPWEGVPINHGKTIETEGTVRP